VRRCSIQAGHAAPARPGRLCAGCCAETTAQHNFLCTLVRSLSDGTNVSEPNNVVNPPEYCGLANFTTANGNETHIAWGWADESCDKKYTYMCKVSSEWRRLCFLASWLAGCQRCQRCKWRSASCASLSAVGQGLVCVAMRGRLTPRATPSSAAGPGAAPWYTTNATGNTFYLNTTVVDSATAEESCKRNGGHLAAYISLEEQAEVEQFYIKRGFLLSKFHQVYWTGLRVSSAARAGVRAALVACC
jgi:hypothetical protein